MSSPEFDNCTSQTLGEYCAHQRQAHGLSADIALRRLIMQALGGYCVLRGTEATVAFIEDMRVTVERHASTTAAAH